MAVSDNFQSIRVCPASSRKSILLSLKARIMSSIKDLMVGNLIDGPLFNLFSREGMREMIAQSLQSIRLNKVSLPWETNFSSIISTPRCLCPLQCSAKLLRKFFSSWKDVEIIILLNRKLKFLLLCDVFNGSADASAALKWLLCCSPFPKTCPSSLNLILAFYS